ncbi:RHS repeat-associated core domain-containing protein [Flavobacterium pectinovorum]|uniref:RHS repeat-associated core domain-containing protein n=1 Tax=Flavobacterium pectinovorum TaxID=29533 RepID=UPI00265E06D1|nr:RHS repeat-associated core domain-containing protein [Flavobacterium pectinovorum]WKL48419.1 RHS repeat-associated core domain-containing protein [Flavobacterium pectinovorum]
MSFNNTQSNAEQSKPQVATFQFDNKAIGQVKDSVNLFTGTANIPINIATFQGRKGLDVDINMMYNSNVQNSVKNWNISNPTGILGLGWDMSFDKIAVKKNGSGTTSSDEYFLVSNGSSNQLIQDGFLPTNPVNILLYQLRNYEFWDIQYDAYNEKWTIIKEDGTVFIYGDKNSGRNTVQYGVQWGNWIGASNLTIGQEHFASAWNLSEVINTWGESVLYTYDNVEVAVGNSNGLFYTQASYLKKIEDSFKRTIVFFYGEKYGAKNPSTKNIVEYQSSHTNQPKPNAYQDSYETRYLDHIEVKNKLNILQFTILFEYDFINLGSNSQAAVYPLLWKRVLKSFWQVQPSGNTLPGIEFEYYDKIQDINSGALKSILYPQGARAIYTYKEEPLNSSRNIKINAPFVNATPRVWFGSDYTVITWYDKANKKLVAKVHSWSGNWSEYVLNSDVSTKNYFNNVDFDIDSLGVVTKQDYIALYFTDKTKKQFQLFLYRRNPEQFGTFNLTNGAQYFPLQAAASKVSVESGKDFVIVSSKDITTTPITAFQWNWKQKTWNNSANSQQGGIAIALPSPADVSKASDIAIKARDNFYIATFYNFTSKLLQFQLFYHNGNNIWSKSVVYNTPNVSIYKNASEGLDFPLNLTLSTSFGVATYITNQTATKISYSLRILQWDKNFNMLNAGTPLVKTYESPIVNGKSQYQLFSTLVTDSLISNNPFLNRYIGGMGNTNNPLNWKATSFITKPEDIVSFATGIDVATMSKQQGQNNSNQYLQFNPNTGLWGVPQNLASTGKNSTVSSNYMTVGKDVFYQNTDGNWIKQTQQLNNLNAPKTVQNRAPKYIAYQDTTDATAQTYFVNPINGGLSTPIKLPITSEGPGQKIVVDQETVKAGTLLAGADVFVTYPSNQEFDTCASLALYKVVDGTATDSVQVTPVSYIAITNDVNNEEAFYQSYDYARSAQSIITYDSRSGLAQFPKVTTFIGTKIPDVNLTTSGILISYFSNGVSVQNEIPYNTNWVYNYSQLLNGALLQKLQYDKKGNLVSKDINYWQLFTTNLNQKNYLFGAFFRINKTLSEQDGVTQLSTVEYYQDLGLPMRSFSSYYDSNGDQKTITSEKKYAIQIPSYQAAMQQKHLLNAIAQESVFMSDKNIQKKCIASKTVTWKNWSTDTEWKWSPFQNFEWLGNDKNTPNFDFSSTQNNTDWLKKQEVVSRGVYDTVNEMMDVEGTKSSYIYSTDAQFQIAEFLTASKIGEEASFVSFESYEDNEGWTILPNASIIPNDLDTTIDAKIGQSSLKIEKGIGIQNSFTPQNQLQEYVFSSYVKLPEGFDPTKGDAKWMLSFSQNGTTIGNEIDLSFGNEVGKWVYVYQILNLKEVQTSANSAITITIKAQNNNAATAVLVDCIRFSPLQSLFSAASVNTQIDAIQASLGSNGEVKRKFFDNFQRVIANTSFAEKTTSIATSYFSRTGNDNIFSKEDPNSKLKIMAVNGGDALSFNQGNEWKNYWTPSNEQDWQTENGLLNYTKSSSEGILNYKGNELNDYGLLVQLMPKEIITNTVGIKIGDQYTVQWNPSSSQWELLGSDRQILQSKKQSLKVSKTQSEDEVQSLLVRAGLYSKAIKNAVKAKKGAIYESEFNKFYTIEQRSDATEIVTLAEQWTLMVTKNTLLFFADGRLVFNYASSSIISGKLSLFTNNKISINSLLTIINPMATQTFVNAVGNDKQSQLLDNTRMTVIENTYNNQGSIIANTKPAFVEASNTTPVFKYIADFAIYNPTTQKMQGLIADAYQEDEGYPYFGYRYEVSPLGRILEQSMPGVAFKLGANTQQYQYGSNTGTYGLPKGEYYEVSVTDQNGNKTYTITDKRNQEVRKVSQKSEIEEIVSAVYYNDLGYPIRALSPNYEEGGLNSEDWISYQTYSFIGQLISTSNANGGTTEMIYDRANRLRFRQDAEGKSQGNYQYYKYDLSGRISETGYFSGVWDRNTLQDQANYHPEYPENVATWRMKTYFDYNGTTAPYQIGQVVKTENNHSDKGNADVVENFLYDSYGNVISRTQKVVDFDNENYETRFYYNNLGGITQIDYPVEKGNAPYAVYYTYNSIGQIESIGNTAASSNIASYIYNPAGKPLVETLNPIGTSFIRNYGYNSPVWLDTIKDTKTKDSSFIFQETLQTSLPEGPAYYNGQSAAISFQYPSDMSAGSTFTNTYNALNALENVKESRGQNELNTKQYQFDNNGNFDTITINSKTYQFEPEIGKGDRLQKVTDTENQSTLFDFQYNLNGSIAHYQTANADGYEAQQLQFSYDAGSRMTAVINDLNLEKQYKLFYNSSSDRVLKQKFSSNSVQERTLYVKSLSGNPLVQIKKSTSSQETLYMVYGPIGVVSFVKNEASYFTLKDHLGSVRVIMDESANPVAAYEYDVYGNVTIVAQPETDFFPYLFTSQEYDYELGIYNYKARFYFSRIGRFGVIDNYNQFFSPYIYAGNSPLVYIDPSGNFSIGNFFSAIGGAIIGAFEILIGVAIDALAGVLEVVTGGLSTPVSIGLASLAGAFIGVGVSSVTYSAVSLITNDFSWKEYGINTAIGFVAGAITGGFGAAGSIAAEAATGVKAAAEAGQAVSNLAKVANAGIKGAFAVTGAELAATTSTLISNTAHGNSLGAGLDEALIKGVLSATLSWAIPIDYKSGWGNLFSRIAANVAKAEGIGVSVQLGSNAVQGNSLDTGLMNTVVKGFVGGSVGALGTKSYATARAKNEANFMNLPATQNQPAANGIIRL